LQTDHLAGAEAVGAHHQQHRVITQTTRRAGVHCPQQLLNLVPWQGTPRLFEPGLHRSDHRVCQVDVDAPAGQQKTSEGAHCAGDVCCRGASIATGALDEECVDVSQAHPSPGLAATCKVLQQLADVVELLLDRALRVASMLAEVGRVVAQQCHGGRRLIGDHAGTAAPMTS
jgi:hypothetical protein